MIKILNNAADVESVFEEIKAHLFVLLNARAPFHLSVNLFAKQGEADDPKDAKMMGFEFFSQDIDILDRILATEVTVASLSSQSAMLHFEHSREQDPSSSPLDDEDDKIPGDN